MITQTFKREYIYRLHRFFEIQNSKFLFYILHYLDQRERAFDTSFSRYHLPGTSKEIKLDSFRSIGEEKRSDRIFHTSREIHPSAIRTKNLSNKFQTIEHRLFLFFSIFFFFFHPLHLRVSSGVDQLQWKEVSRTYSLKPAETERMLLDSP